MASVLDVAAYILSRKGRMSAMKLQKLTYYAQAWSLAWDDRPMFPERIEAWANGPVSPDLYRAHAGQFEVDAIPRGDAQALDATAVDTVEAILRAYGDKPSWWLSNLTHTEDPWVNARGDTPDGERSSAEIPHSAMAEYYNSL